MSYTKIKKFNDSFESLHSLAYGEDFLREYANLCEIASSVYKTKKVDDSESLVLDTNSLFGYINFVVYPIVKTLKKHSLILFPDRKEMIINQIDEIIPKLLNTSRLLHDVRFDSYFSDLNISFKKLVNLFTEDELNTGYLKEIGFIGFMDIISKLGHKESSIPTDPMKRLNFYNLYRILEYFKKEILDKSNILNKTKYNLMYEEILNSKRESRVEMLATATLMHKLINEKSKNTKSTLKIDGLKHPLRWEQITILFDGDYIKVRQADTLLGGELFLEDIGIRKAKKTGAKTSPHTFFTFLFIKISNGFSNQLNSTNNLNQQNKMVVSKALKELFGTSEDPIDIDDNNYIPKFKASTYGSLAEIDIENYRSGSEIYE